MDFLSIFYPPGAIRGHLGTGTQWSEQQAQALRVAGFEVNRSVDRFTGRQIGTDELRVITGSSEYLRLLRLFSDLGVRPAERIQSCWMPKMVRDYDFYAIDFGSPTDGFDGGNLFADQADCAQPPPEGPLPGPRGCGLGKPQIGDLRLVAPDRVRRADIMPVWVAPYCENWRLLVVTTRLYRCMMEANLSGVEFRPVGGVNGADYMQLIITGRTAPVPLSGIDADRVCTQCGRSNGTELKSVEFFRWTPDRLSSVDLQVSEQYVLPDGRVIRKKGYDQMIASARFIEMLMNAKARGLSFKGESACAGPLYVERRGHAAEP